MCNADEFSQGPVFIEPLITPPFVEPFCRSVGARSTTQPWRTDPFLPNNFTTQRLNIKVNNTVVRLNGPKLVG